MYMIYSDLPDATTVTSQTRSVEMHYEDCQSINAALLTDRSPSLTRSRSTREHTRWKERTNVFNASLRRIQSPFRRPTLHNCSSTSFPLFRRFYMMRSSFRDRRLRLSRSSTITDDALALDRFHSAPRIKTKHVVYTLLITVVSALVLILTIYLDLIYLNDAIAQLVRRSRTGKPAYLCSHSPKVCAMKSIVVIVFVSITVLLCYTILTMHKRAQRHRRVLERKTDELEKEKSLTQKLLHQILPPCVAKELINGRKAPAEYYESVTVYFSDIVGFTNIASMCSATETCDMLNQLYSIFDSLLENFDVYKVETIGDAYMVVSGAPTRNGDRHPNEIVNMSLSLIRAKQQVRVPRTFAELQLRVGIHTGPVCAAVIGSKMPRYCMFGDTVNVANRMESSGLPERIHLSVETYKRLTNREQYVFEDRGEIEVKGKGLIRTYFLVNRISAQKNDKRRSNSMLYADV